MRAYFLLLTFFLGPVHGNVMQEFISPYVPLREDGKIDIPQGIQHIKLDIGLSYSAPMSQYWLSHEENLWVFGFEPDRNSVNTIKNGAIKLDVSHGEPLDKKYVGTTFFPIPCALGRLSGGLEKFYITKIDCGRSSLYRPKDLEIETIVEVPVFRLSDFFDMFPFDTHPVVDYIKIDAQGSDLDIAKSAEKYIQERVVYVTIEAENSYYENTTNSEMDIDSYMQAIGFRRIYTQATSDPTYFNPKFEAYIQNNDVKIFQKG